MFGTEQSEKKDVKLEEDEEIKTKISNTAIICTRLGSHLHLKIYIYFIYNIV